MFNSNFDQLLHPNARDRIHDYNIGLDELKDMYLNGEDVTGENKEKLIELIGDLYIVEGVHAVVKTQVLQSCAPTYLYRYTFDKDVSPMKAMMNVMHLKG